MSESRRQLSRFTAIFAAGTLFSRAFGLVRDIVVLGMLPSAAREAFLLAFKFPNMLRDMFGEGATNAVFVPLFSASREKDSEADYKRLVSATLSAMLLLFLFLTVAGVLLMPLLPLALEAMGRFTGAVLAPDVRLLQWIFPYFFFIGLAAFATAPLFAAKRYAIPAWSPVLLNIALIASCLLLRDRFDNPAYALAAGVWLGGAAQFLLLFASMKKHSGVVLPNFQLRHPGVRRASLLLLPVVLGQSAGEVNKLVDSLFAYNLGEVSTLYAANRIVQLPLSVFGIGVAVAILPALSRAAARQEPDRLRETLIDGLRRAAFLILPAMAGMIVLAGPILRLLFERGAWSQENTDHAAAALVYYGAGLLSFAWVKVAAQGFFAVHDTKTPVIAASLSMLLNIALNLALVGPMGYRGLALATTLAFTANFLGLFVFFGRRHGKLWDAPMLLALGKMALASVIMAALVHGLNLKLEAAMGIETLLARACAVLAPVALGAACYAATCKLLKVPELNHMLGSLKKAPPQ